MGFRLGRYEVVKTLAKGVLTDLLLGRATGMEGFERYVAIKLLRSDRASQAGCFEAFVNEARLAAVLHHHNIVQVHDIGEDEGQPYFAMEYVHGVDLRTLLARLAKRNEQLPLQHVVAIIAQVAAALHHAHEQQGPDGKPLNIVHRDVSPGNVLVGFDGHVKVVDFGIAKAAINEIHTDAGVLKGQAPYMSPEQCAGRSLDRRSDVFALGIVLYELATVRRLFKGANDFLTMSAVCNAEVPPPSQYRRDIPAELEKIILKALARTPRERFYTAGDVSLALDNIAREVGVGASTSALAHYLKLQFGETKEPWLALRPKTEEDSQEEDDDDFSDVTEVDFDGAASGLAPPPAEAVQKTAIPRALSPTKNSPIVAARTHALTPPPQQRVMPLPSRPKTSTRPPRVEQPILRAATDPISEPSEPTTNEHTTADTQGEVILEPVIVRPSAMFMTPALEAGGTETVEPLSVTAPRMRPRRRTNRSLWILAASLVAAAGSFAVVMLTPGIEIEYAAAEAIEPATSAMPGSAPPIDAAADAAIDAEARQLTVPVPDATPAPAAEAQPAVEMKLDEPPATSDSKSTKRTPKKPAKKR